MKRHPKADLFAGRGSNVRLEVVGHSDGFLVDSGVPSGVVQDGDSPSSPPQLPSLASAKPVPLPASPPQPQVVVVPEAPASPKVVKSDRVRPVTSRALFEVVSSRKRG